MLFRSSPKANLNEFYGRRKEFKNMMKTITKPSSLTVIYGQKNMGKSSLMLTTLNTLSNDKEIRQNFTDKEISQIYIDMEKFNVQKGKIYYNDFASVLNKKITRLKWGRLTPVVNAVKRLEFKASVRPPPNHVSPVDFELEVKLKPDERKENDFVDTLEDLNEWAQKKGRMVVIAIDNAHHLKKMKGVNALESISYVGRELDNIAFVLTGSEAKLKKIFSDNPTLLKGARYTSEIELKELGKNTAISYLKDGFEDQGFIFNNKLAEKVYEKLGGNPGWLTAYGINTVMHDGNSTKGLKKTIEDAKTYFAQEITDFVGSTAPVVNLPKIKKETMKFVESCEKGCKSEDVKKTILRISKNRLTEEDEQELTDIMLNYRFLFEDEVSD